MEKTWFTLSEFKALTSGTPVLVNFDLDTDHWWHATFVKHGTRCGAWVECGAFGVQPVSLLQLAPKK